MPPPRWLRDSLDESTLEVFAEEVAWLLPPPPMWGTASPADRMAERQSHTNVRRVGSRCWSSWTTQTPPTTSDSKSSATNAQRLRH